MINKKTIQIIIVGLIAVLVLGLVVTIGFVMSDGSSSDSSADDSTTQPTPDNTTGGNVPDSTTSATDVTTTSPDNDTTTSLDSSTTDAPESTTTPDNTEAPTTTIPDTELPQLSGRFISENESHLKLVVDWKTLKRSETSTEVEFKVILSHYSLFVGPRTASTFEVAGKEFKFNTANIDQAEVKKTETLFAIYKVTLPLDNGNGEFDLSASWVFNGTYGGIELGTLTIDEKLIIK